MIFYRSYRNHCHLWRTSQIAAHATVYSRLTPQLTYFQVHMCRLTCRHSSAPMYASSHMHPVVVFRLPTSQIGTLPRIHVNWLPPRIHVNWHSASHTRQLALASHIRQLAFRLAHTSTAYTSIGSGPAYTSTGSRPGYTSNWLRFQIHVTFVVTVRLCIL